MLARGFRSSSFLRKGISTSASFKAVARSTFPKTLSAGHGYNHLIAHSFSTNKETGTEGTEQPAASKDTAVAKYDYDEYDDYEEPTTAGGWVKHFTIIGMRLGMLALAGVCIYFTAKELFPGRMGPQTLFSEAFERVRVHEEVMAIAGNGMKAFGRDVGRNTEGRRNHIDSYQYTGEDGSRRTRIRFNVKGDKAKVLVWAETSDRMAENEYVYLICQSTKTGKVVTVEDNRDRLEMELEQHGGPVDVSANFINNLFTKKD
mmetsp:Transcript_42106/g.83722  ORF Transcript_42106/g.83722 Transcript_42106/m.83722 type:complete len:260 (+) Transcript_42106:49-828(+)